MVFLSTHSSVFQKDDAENTKRTLDFVFPSHWIWINGQGKVIIQPKLIIRFKLQGIIISMIQLFVFRLMVRFLPGRKVATATIWNKHRWCSGARARALHKFAYDPVKFLFIFHLWDSETDSILKHQFEMKLTQHIKVSFFVNLFRNKLWRANNGIYSILKWC